MAVYSLYNGVVFHPHLQQITRGPWSGCWGFLNHQQYGSGKLPSLFSDASLKNVFKKALFPGVHFNSNINLYHVM